MLLITFISLMNENSDSSIFVLLTQNMVSPIPTNSRINCGKYDNMKANAITINM